MSYADESSKCRGRGGRGVTLREALATAQRKPGNEVRSSPSDTESSCTTTTSGGRGAMLAAMYRQHSLTSDRGGCVSGSSDSAAPTGRGKAMLLRQMQQSLDTASSEAASRGQQQQGLPQHSPPTQDMGKLSMEDKTPVTQHGINGKEIPLTANYIRLLLEPGKGVFEYEVCFCPDIDFRDFRFKLLGEMSEIIGNSKTFDGVTLYLPFQLKDKVTKYSSVHPSNGSSVEVVVNFRRKKRMGECTHLYNVLLKRIMSELKLARLGRQHFDPLAAKLIPQHKLEVWPGYVTAVDEYEGGILLCCDSSSRVLRSQTVLEVIYEIANHNRNSWQTDVKNVLLGASVLTRYNNRLYRVDEVDFSMNPLSTFTSSSGGQVSFLEYYKKQYNLDVRDQGQPMLQSRIKKKQRGMEDVEQLVVLIPELCYMTGLTDEMKNDFKVMKDIATYTRITPNQRYYALKQYLASVARNQKATQMLKDWGLKLEPDTVELQGRVVESEKIFFEKGAEFQTNQNADWSNQLTRSRVFHAVDLLQWVVVHTYRDSRYANDFVSTMLRVGTPMGMKVNNPNMIPLQDDRTESYLRVLREVITPKLQLVVIIFPTARDDRYAAVKRVCCAEYPIASQVINSRTLSRPDKIRSIVQKIALQINCKVGGSLWTIANPYKACMVVGIDSYHDKVGQGRSVGGFVASLNSTLTHWYSRVCIQSANQELINGLKMCFIDALQRYHGVNNRFPERVFVFRDGVGDGQLEVALQHEVEQLRSCFSSVAPDYKPKLTFVVVQKRINTRLFAIRGKDLDNPPPGTVMDHTVNRRFLYDFFLVSQCVRQGTVSPTHYIVLYDSDNIKPDHVQRFSYKLCHMYYNWPGTVRVPAPCQYAHKLSQLVGMHLRREHHPHLSERLFYL